MKSSLSSYRVLWLCHQRLTPKYREYIQQVQSTKHVYHLRSPEQISQFFELLNRKDSGGPGVDCLYPGA